MRRYELRLPATPTRSQLPVNLELAELGPEVISFPLLAAAYRAVLGDADFAIHLAGETGAFKSEVAVLPTALRRSNESAPPRSRERGRLQEVPLDLGLLRKDAIVVMDDFAPQGNSADVARSCRTSSERPGTVPAAPTAIPRPN